MHNCWSAVLNWFKPLSHPGSNMFIRQKEKGSCVFGRWLALHSHDLISRRSETSIMSCKVFLFFSSSFRNVHYVVHYDSLTFYIISCLQDEMNHMMSYVWANDPQVRNALHVRKVRLSIEMISTDVPILIAKREMT